MSGRLRTDGWSERGDVEEGTRAEGMADPVQTTENRLADTSGHTEAVDGEYTKLGRSGSATGQGWTEQDRSEWRAGWGKRSGQGNGSGSKSY